MDGCVDERRNVVGILADREAVPARGRDHRQYQGFGIEGMAGGRGGKGELPMDGCWLWELADPVLLFVDVMTVWGEGWRELLMRKRSGITVAGELVESRWHGIDVWMCVKYERASANARGKVCTVPPRPAVRVWRLP